MFKQAYKQARVRSGMKAQGDQRRVKSALAQNVGSRPGRATKNDESRTSLAITYTKGGELLSQQSTANQTTAQL